MISPQCNRIAEKFTDRKKRATGHRQGAAGALFFFISKSKNKKTPNTAVKPTAEKVLNLSGTPKYSFGTTFVPIAPISIIANAIVAKTAMERWFLSRYPPTMIVASEATDNKTTNTVTT